MPSSPPGPPTYRSSTSLSRSEVSTDEISSLADAILRASLTRSSAGGSAPATSSVSTPRPAPTSVADRIRNDSLTARGHPPSSSSLTRNSSARSTVQSSADEMLRRSLLRDASASVTSLSTPPPPYSQVPAHSLSGKSSLTSTIWSSEAGSSSSSQIIASNGDTKAKSKADGKRFVRELERDVSLIKAQLNKRPTGGIFKAACSTDLLFLIDTTSSMQDYIDSAKEQVKSIVADIQKQFFSEAKMRIAVVSYRDHTDLVNIQFKDFTTSVADVYTFLDGLVASGGADMPEDVLGGINQALNASWQQQTRCIIHIADAPGHGPALHDFGKAHDDYHSSEPHGLDYKALVKRMTQLHINYGLLRINQNTDKMCLVFSQIYATAGASTKLLQTNYYYGQALHKSPSNARLHFEEMRLGADHHHIRRLVVGMVTRSVSGTASRMSDSLENRSTGTKAGAPRKLGNLSMIHEDNDGNDDSRTINLEKTQPQWSSQEWLDKTWQLEGVCPDVVHNADTLSDMIASDAAIKLSYAELTVHARSRPFDKGAVRTACYARTAASRNRYVLKSFIKQDQKKDALIDDMHIQALCKSFALEFNSLLKLDDPIDFVVMTCMQPNSQASTESDFMFLEPYIPGDYVKYNGNNGYVCEVPDHPFFDVAQAFSHFTFERSWGQLLVNDLQGVDNILTDPAIQTKDPERFKSSQTNLNAEGFKFWFSSHASCNPICGKLGLKSNANMLLTGKFDFRRTWPPLAPTTCCSNKLCRKIIKLANAYTSDDLPGHKWCDGCWPQLTMLNRACSNTDCLHIFKVSDFFYESQGQRSPQQCEQHREKDKSNASTAAVGASLFSAMRSTRAKGAEIDSVNW